MVDNIQAQAHVSQQRAKKLNQKSLFKREEEVQSKKRELFERLEKMHGKDFLKSPNTDLGKLWQQCVNSREMAEAFMEIMYPQFPKPVQLAYVHMFERAIAGEIELDPRLIRNSDEDLKAQEKVWNPMEDIERERMEGLTERSRQMMNELLKE